MTHRYIGASALALALFPLATIQANQANELNPDVSVILDGYYKQNQTALSHRDQGFGLGHTELSLSSPIDDLFEGRLTAVLEDHEGETELELEEAFLQTTGMPYNLSVRGGRFLSRVSSPAGKPLFRRWPAPQPVTSHAFLLADWR